MKTVFLIIGLIAVLMGFFWIGQGAGYINWPSNSFMLSQVRWTFYGAGLAFAGVVVICVCLTRK